MIIDAIFDPSKALHPTADAAVEYLHTQWGISKKGIKSEQIISPNFSYRPTLSAVTQNHHTLCVEVSEGAYSNSLDSFVQECVAKNFPVKLYVAMPKDVPDPYYSSNLKRAKANGVGVIEVDNNGGVLVSDAISLSLAKLRPIDLESFPAKYREALAKAENTFRSASPEKGCSLLFDEMEDYCRKFATKLNERKLWKDKKKKLFDYEVGPWANLVELIKSNIDTKRSKCPELKPAFLSRIHGLTGHRNESGHKPKDQAALIKRDREIRTRFESATDTFFDLITYTKTLRV